MGAVLLEGANSLLERVQTTTGENRQQARPDLQRFRLEVHARIPWPMEKGLKQESEVLDAMADERTWRGLYDQTIKMVENNERMIDRAKRKMPHFRDS